MATTVAVPVGTATDHAHDETCTRLPAEVGAHYRVSPRTAGNWARGGVLPAFKTPGGEWRFCRLDLAAFS